MMAATTAERPEWLPPAGDTAPRDTVLNWRDHLIVTEKGTPKALLANATTALRHAPQWIGVLKWDEFRAGLVVARKPLWDSPEVGGQWTDQEDRKVCEWLQHEGIYVKVNEAGLAAQTVAMENRVNPVRDYLESLKWDGTKRTDELFPLYFGAETNNYAREIGRRFLIAAAARVLSPQPVKSDCVPVLEGPQGSFKSTAVNKLFHPWFTDHLPDLTTKDAYLQLAGVWCVELGEMDTISRASITKVKAFLSSEVDRYRLPYGRRAIDVPRHNVFVGTVNKDQYLLDETGARRFWPVRCGIIRVDELARDRDQLWAEAVSQLRAGAAWWLDSPELNQEAKREQSARFESDPWDELIVPWLRNPQERYDQQGHPVAPFNSTVESVSVMDVLNHCIGKRQDQWTQVDKNRIARCLRSQSWERYQFRAGENRDWRYRRSK